MSCEFDYPPSGLSAEEIAKLALARGRGFRGIGKDDPAPAFQAPERGILSFDEALGAAFDHVAEFISPRPQDRISHLEYLRTPEWRQKRRLALDRSGRTCQRCDATNTRLEVHHLTYDRLGREFESDLIVLCSECHRREHGRSVP